MTDDSKLDWLDGLSNRKDVVRCNLYFSHGYWSLRIWTRITESTDQSIYSKGDTVQECIDAAREAIDDADEEEK